ncbi:hypothetical protein CASFOL_015869 [Castilleja foliolosa]|uniref:Uncharacterized protein n=1 Tax=Castilleja foliolosa TaxID=1961234 RepID=A0ABD3DJ13_9LAMI
MGLSLVFGWSKFLLHSQIWCSVGDALTLSDLVDKNRFTSTFYLIYFLPFAQVRERSRSENVKKSEEVQVSFKISEDEDVKYSLVSKRLSTLLGKLHSKVDNLFGTETWKRISHSLPKKPEQLTRTCKSPTQSYPNKPAFGCVLGAARKIRKFSAKYMRQFRKLVRWCILLPKDPAHTLIIWI